MRSGGGTDARIRRIGAQVDLGLLCSYGGEFVLTVEDGVDAVGQKLAVLLCASACFRQREGPGRSEAHISGALVQGVAIDPGLAAAAGDLQVQAGAIVIEARFVQGTHHERGQAITGFGHEFRHPYPYNAANCRELSTHNFTLTERCGFVGFRAILWVQVIRY